MLLKIGCGLLISFFAVMLLNEPAAAQRGSLCRIYANVYDDSNKELSSVHAQGLFDDSAPRATYRELQALNAKTTQLIVLQQMEAYGCDIPKEVSSHIHYQAPAMACHIGGYDSERCDKDTWIPATGR